MRTQPRILIVLPVVLCALGWSGCGSSERALRQAQDRVAFASRTAYAPDNLTEAVGCYVAFHGFGGEALELRPDGTYFYRSWTDLIDPEDPVLGDEGEYRVIGDVVVLPFGGYALDTTKAPDRIAEAEQRAEERRRVGRAEVFRLKRVEGAVYVVKDKVEWAFAQAALENGGAPPTQSFRGKEYSVVGMRRGPSEACDRWRGET
jgi:hypothetical protein